MTVNVDRIESTITNALRIAAEQFDKDAASDATLRATFEGQAKESRELMNEIEERGIKAVTARCPD